MNRADLHALVDTLPEAAVINAERMLQQLQTWPPQPPPEIERMRELQRDQMQRMRRSIRPGTAGGGGGGGRFTRGAAEYGYPRSARWEDATMSQEFAEAGYAHCGNTRFEDSTVIQDSCHWYKGHEVAVIERLRFADDGKVIHYSIEAKGPIPK